MPAGPDAYGQQWFLEAAPPRANADRPAASVFVDDLTVYAFHLYDGVAINPMNYDVSTDGGQTFPTLRVTTFNPVGNDHVMSVRMITLADGTTRFVLLLNASQAIAYSDTVLTLPTASTWTQLTPAGSVSAPIGMEFSGLNGVVALQDGAGNIKLDYSLDGGATWAAATTNIVDITTTSFGYQLFASPSAGTWFFLNPNSGKVYASFDSGNNWSVGIKTIPAGDVTLDAVSAIFATSPTRVVACFKGQVTVGTLNVGVWTWVDKQNLTLVAFSPVHVKQGGLAAIASYGLINGVQMLGAATNYATAFNATTTRGAMWRSIDQGETWTLINAVGGGLVTTNPSTRVTAFTAKQGRGVIDIWNSGTTHRNSWYNPNPPPIPAPPAVMSAQLMGVCSAFTVCPCPSTCD